MMGIVAVVAVVAVLAAIFFVGLARIRLADRGAPLPSAPLPSATHPVATAPVEVPVGPPAEPLPAVSIQAVELPAEKAVLRGALKLDNDVSTERAHSHKRPGTPPDLPPVVRQAITGFHDEGDAAEWTAKITKPGLYEVDIVYASLGTRDKSESCLLTVGDQELHADTLHTRGRENYQVLTVGNLTLPIGDVPIRFRLAEPAHGSILRLRSLRLIPAT
jgi:hypothetical protein